MALALESLTFSVETKELENAIQKIKELGQAASSLNKPIEQLGKQASESAKKVEQAASSSKKLEQANNKAASATDTLTAATTRAERSNTKQVSGVDKLQNLLNKLGNTYSDVSNGLTRGESNVLNTARSYGALESQLEPVKKLLEQIKGLTKDPFDSAIGSVRRITQEFEALKQRADLANSGIFLTTKQLQEYSKIANEVKGKIISSGIKETDAAFMSKYNALLQATQEEYKQTAKNVNNWQAEEKLHNEELKRQEQTLIKNATAMDDVAMRWKSMQAQYADKAAAEALKEQNRLLEQGAVAMDVAVQKWKALQIAKQEKEANEALKEQNRLMQQGAVMMDDVVSKYKAIQIAKADQEANEQLKEQNRLQQQGLAMMDNAVEKYKALQIAKTDQEANKQLVEQERLLKQNATAMDAVVNRWKQMQAQKADQEANKQLAEQNRLMQQGLTAMDSAVQKYKALQIAKADQEANKQLAEQNRLMQQGLAMMDSAVQKYKASQIAKEQEQLNEQLREQNRLQQQGATAMDSAVIEFYNRKHQALQDLVKAEQFLATQEEKLQFVTAKTAEGFTVASANALYRYEQSLKKAGVTEQEFIGRSSAYATALKARQDVSDTNARRKAATEELIRIEKQLEDQEKFLAYATAEFSKQQQQATAGTQNFSDTLNVGMLRSLFAYEQALRRAGVAEADVVAKSAAMRQQMIQMQQATESFNGSVNHLGRNIGVQFTDIFVSLYNGQPVMQVITQQGGQLADAFLLAGVSGANMSQHLVDGFKKIMESYKLLGNAFAGLAGTALDSLFGVFGKGMDDMQKALAKTTPDAERFNYVMKGLSETLRASLRSNIILIATAVAAMAVEFLKADFAMDKLNKTLIQYGAALGITAQQGEELAMQVGVATTASIGAARDAILAFAKEGVEVTAEAVAKAVELNDYLGISFEDSAKKAAQFKKEPVEALIEMAKKTGEVDLATLEYVASLELAGNQQQAIKAAIEAKDKAETAAIARAKVGLSGLSELWLVIKQSISNAGDEMVVFLTTSKTLRTIYAGVGAIINTLLYGTAQIYEGWRAIFSVLAAAATGSIDNINASLAESARRMTGVNNDVMKLYDDLYKFATADAKANDEAAEAAARRTQENSKAAGKFQKELALREQLARDLGKADANKLTRQQYINASIEEEMRKLGFITKNQEILNTLTKKYGEEWDKANKSRAKPKTSFSTNTGNELVETGKLFEQRLLTEQKLAQDQLAILNNYYEAGFYSKGSYLAQELNLVTRNREQQLQILNEYNKAEIKAFADKEAQLQANAATAIAKGGNRAEIEKQLARNLEDLNRQKQTFNEKITGKQEQVYSTYLKTLSKSLEEVSKSTDDVIKAVDSFDKEIQKQQASRKADIEFTVATIGMSEKEIDVLKAKMQAASQYNKLLIDTAKAQADAESTFWEFVQSIDPMNSEALDKAWGMWAQLQKTKQALVAAGIQSEEEQRIAMQDAAMQHDLANYKKLKEGIADAITSGLLDGASEGKKKLRDIITAELRKPITLFINAVVNTGLQNLGFGQGTAGSALGAVNFVESVSSAYKLFTSGLTNSLASVATGIGEAIGSSAAVEFGMGMKVAAFGGETAGLAGAASTGASFGAAMPWVAGGLLTYNLLSGLDSSGTPHTGGAGGYSAARGTTRQADFLSGSDWWNNAYDKTNEAITSAQNIAKTIVTALDKTAITFGKTAGYEVWTGFADDASSDPAWSRLFIKNLDNVLVNLDPQFADGQEGVKQYSKFLADNVVGILDGMNLPSWTQAITKDLSAFGDALTIEQVVQAIDTINNVNAMFKKFSQAMNLSQESLLGTISAFGSVDAATQMLSSYYDGFYSEAEKTAFSVVQLNTEFTKLNLKMPTSTEEFRKLVEAQDQTTDAGKKTFNALISLNSAFLSVVQSIETVAQAYKRLTTINLSNEQIAQQRIDLEDELLKAVGDSEAIRAKEYVTIDKTNQSLWLLVKSFEDLDKLSSDLDSALSNAASAAEKVKSIQDKATSNYVQAQDRVAEAQKKIKDIQNENLKQQIEKAKELSNAFSDLSKSLKDFVYGEIKPSSQLFSETLKKALAGNQEAMKELPDAATAAIEQAKNTSGTLEEYERKRAKILAGVLQVASVADSKSISSAANATSLEAKLTPEQTAMQQAQQELEDAMKEQKDALKVANAIGASLVLVQEDLIAEYKAAKAEQTKADAEVVSISTQLTNLANATADLATATGNLPAALAAISINAEANIKSSITMATASDLPTELKQIALASLNDLQSNFKVVSSNKSMPAEVKQVAMASITSSSSNFGVIAKSTSMPTELKQLALGAASAVTSNISTVVTQAANGKIPESISKLALGASEGISTTITTTVTQAETGVIPESIAELVLNSVNGLSTDVTANVIQSGSLDEASKATILSATDAIAKTFNVTVQNANGTTVPAVISNLALKTNEQLAKSLGVTVELAKNTSVPAVISTLAGTAIDTVSRTISTSVVAAAGKTIPQEIITLAGTTTDTIGKTISVTLAAAQAGAFPTWVTELALNSTNNAAKTVDVAINQAAANKDKPWITNLKLLTADAVSKTVKIAMGGDPTLTAAQAALKITSADNLLKTVDLALSDSNLTAYERALIASLVHNVDGTIKIEGGSGILTVLNSIENNTATTASMTAIQAKEKVYELADLASQKGTKVGAMSTDYSKLIKLATSDGSLSQANYVRNFIVNGASFADFDAQRYLEKNPDLERAYYRVGAWRYWEDTGGEDAWLKWHYINYGLREGREYANGGYTGHGGKYQPAGIVHAGEVVFSQEDIARLGGVNVVEGIRTGEIPMFANGGIVQPMGSTSVQVTKHDNSELVEELQNLREEVKMLRAEARATAMNTSKTARILDDVTQGGTEVKVAQTEEFIALFGK